MMHYNKATLHIHILEMPMSDTTLFAALGGTTGITALAQAWHHNVMADEVVSHAFQHGFHPQHIERLATYWCEAWGGPPLYTTQYGNESSMVRIHSGNGLHPEMDERAIACFDQAMVDIGIYDVRLSTTLHNYFAWVTHTALAAYPTSAETVPSGLHVPHWSWEGLIE